ncbi:hypothetical protein P879_04298 [Paragonimus westermani]|uniref:Uncharacterized protein n=1 Tax=Paragonimus westermani TaxID=34504 RepID=A0A8T0DHT3_9TREM|nr:hypothetical protein P879_04298 [Paragonimus westermani]
MSNINLIDKAIKSFVEIPRVKSSRITYTRLQLLSYRFCRVAQQWPPSFDRRFMRLKNRRNPNLVPLFDRNYDSRFRFFSGISPRNAPVYQKTIDVGDRNCNLTASKMDSDKARFHDDAIVSAQLSTKKLLENAVPLISGDRKNRDYSRYFYDHQSLQNTWSRSRPKHFRYTSKKPEWYICGPQDVGDEMELNDYDLLNGDDEKENKLLTKPVKSSECYFGQKTISGAAFKNNDFPMNNRSHNHENGEYDKLRNLRTWTDDHSKSSLVKGVENDNRKNDRPPNIKTLREIESMLNIHNTDSNPSTDMSAYYKLLGIIGTSIQRGFAKKGSDPLPDVNYKSTNNNQTESYITTSTEHSSRTAQLLTDPAISEVVSEGYYNCVTHGSDSGCPCVKIHNSSPLMQKLERLGKASRITCNPLAASYQRQFMATAHLGQNTLRWFKAMTNAASASACISQHLDGSTATSGDQCYNDISKGNLILDAKTTVPGEERPYVIENFVTQSSMQSDYPPLSNLNKPVNFLNGPRLRPTFGLPFYFHQSDNVLSSAMRIGMNMNFPQRPLKPLTLYYNPHTTQLLGRPMIHPFILQQLVQRQMDLKNAAQQLPLNHSRQQSVISMLNENTHLSTCKPSTGPQNEDSLEGSSSSEITFTYQQSPPLPQGTHRNG